jgi:hypothetical protein
MIGQNAVSMVRTLRLAVTKSVVECFSRVAFGCSLSTDSEVFWSSPIAFGNQTVYFRRINYNRNRLTALRPRLAAGLPLSVQSF